jgi:GDP-L-fucose synthase
MAAFMPLSAKIFIAGVSGMVGSALARVLLRAGYENLVGSYHSRRPGGHMFGDTENLPSALRLEALDLTRQSAVETFFARERPDFVFLAAAKVGGIHANNTYPAQFIGENLAMQTHVIQTAAKNSVSRLLFLGSSCIYPKLAPQPLREEYLLSGPLEPTNEPYAIAKIAGIKMCESYNRQYGTSFAAVMPTNLYGPHDNFDLETSHVIPALLRKFHEAKVTNNAVTVWGSGRPRREFLHVDDMAEASVFVLNLGEEAFARAFPGYPQPCFLNVGTGQDLSISELATLLARVTGFDGEIRFDAARPDGTLRKVLDISRLQNLGWSPRISLEQGLRETYAWYMEQGAGARY